MEELSQDVTNFAFVFALLGILSGLFLGYRAVRKAADFARQSDVRLGRLALNALTGGVALGLIFFSSIVLISIFNPDFPLSLERFLMSCGISLLIVVVITAAGAWLQSWLIKKSRPTD